MTATAFLTPAERMELQNTPSLRGTAIVYSGGGTECERTCAFFLPFYLTAEELDPSEYISAVHFRSFFGEPGHRDYLGALLALGVRCEWVGGYPHPGRGGLGVLPAERRKNARGARPRRALYRPRRGDRSRGRPGGRGEDRDRELHGAEPPARRRDRRGFFHVSRTTAAELIRLGSVSLNYVPCLHTDAAIRDGDVISVRGKGKGTVTDTGGRSRKDPYLRHRRTAGLKI